MQTSVGISALAQKPEAKTNGAKQVGGSRGDVRKKTVKENSSLSS